MSKLEYIHKHLQKAKINNHQLQNLCHCFAYDFTASKTAEKIGLSRQTINSYYKMIREFIIEEELENNSLLFNEKDNDHSFTVQYINIHSKIIYYILYDNELYFLDENDSSLETILKFVNDEVKESLAAHKKANTAKILYHSPQNEYFVSTYLYTNNKLEEYINNRLKKFRGLNKNNNLIHIKESIIRYNNNESFFINSLSSIFRSN